MGQIGMASWSFSSIKGRQLRSEEKLMKMLLYTIVPPQGRCLLLAKQLHQFTTLGGEDCLKIAQRLFDNRHSHDNPVTVEVRESASADDLEATCSELGISVEDAERSDQSSRTTIPSV